MNVSTATTNAPSTIAAIASSTQALSNGHDTTAPTAGTGISALAHSHLLSIEVDPDQRQDGYHPHQETPFWKGFIEEYEDQTGYVAVAFAHARDDSTASRSGVIAQLIGIARRHGYHLSGAEDRSTGGPIEGMPCSLLSHV